MVAATKLVSVSFTAQQMRETYQALSRVWDLSIKEQLKIFIEEQAEWEYQLSDEGYFSVKQLQNSERWANQAMEILSAAAAAEGFPVK